MTRPDKPTALLTLRAAIVLLLSVLAAAAAIVLLLSVLAAATAAGLTWFYKRDAAGAALAGLGAFAAGAKFFDWLIA